MSHVVSDYYDHKWPEGCYHCGAYLPVFLTGVQQCDHGVAYCAECCGPADPAGCKECAAEAAGLTCDMCGKIMYKRFEAKVPGAGPMNLCYICGRPYKPRPSRREARSRRAAKHNTPLTAFAS